MFKSMVERFPLGVEDLRYDVITLKDSNLTSIMASNSV